MVVKIRKITTKGDEQHLLSLEEAAKLIDAEKDRHFVVDVKTMKVLGELKVEDGQELMLVPYLHGG